MEVLNDTLAKLNEEIIRAENNLRIANNKLIELQEKKANIVATLNTIDKSSVNETNITQAVGILDTASTLKDITQIKAEIIKAKDILNIKETQDTEVKI